MTMTEGTETTEHGSPSYRYANGQWEAIELEWDGGDGGFVLGFERDENFTVGSTYSSFCAKVHRRRDARAQGEFLVWAEDHCEGNAVICDRLPDLLSLLGQLAPIIAEVERGGEKADEWEHLRDHNGRAKYCTYCWRIEEQERLSR